VKQTDTELLVNCANHQTAERPLTREQGDARRSQVREQARREHQETCREDALARLRTRVASGDKNLADLLIVLGLESQ
jgi:hypothetical protein